MILDNPNSEQSIFGSISLGKSAQARTVRAIIESALAAVDPFTSVVDIVRKEGAILEIGKRKYNLDQYRKVFLVGAGKAAFPMASAMHEMVGDRLAEGVIVTKEGHLPKDGSAQKLKQISIYEASHPLPDQRGIEATGELIKLLEAAGESDLVICLISGGGSALMTAPVAGVNLGDLQKVTSLLLHCGATINEMNALRKHLDKIKGGGLARLAAPAEMVVLILSDVIGDPLDVIASGPTVADESTFEDCWSILDHYDLIDEIPTSIRAHIVQGVKGETAETLKPGDPILDKVYNQVIGDNYAAASAAVGKAREMGFQTLLLTSYLQGEAREAGQMIAAIVRQIAATGQPLHRPACVIAGGETTVTVRGAGKGGRNTEAALGSVEEMAGLVDVMLVTLATDGGDGPTDAAGAVVTGETRREAAKKGLNSVEFLKRNDSYTFFEEMRDLLKTGPTQTNVNDLIFLFAF